MGLLCLSTLPLNATEKNLSSRDEEDIEYFNLLARTGRANQQQIPKGVVQNIIKPFATPISSHKFPIDLITHATIIPKEWGVVHDICRDENGKIKVLTCKKVNPSIALSSTCGLGVWAASLQFFQPRKTLSALFLLGMATLFGRGVFLSQRSDWTILIYDLATQTLESHFTVRAKPARAFFTTTSKDIPINPHNITVARNEEDEFAYHAIPDYQIANYIKNPLTGEFLPEVDASYLAKKRNRYRTIVMVTQIRT